MTGAVLCPKPGIYRIPVQAYLDDPCPEPSLNGSTIKKLLEESPLHAAVNHPRLTAQMPEKAEDKFDIGKAAHRLITGKGGDLVVPDGDHTSWRKNIEGEKPAEWKEAIRDSGRIPILAHQLTKTERMVEECRLQLADRGISAFRPGEGEGEVTIVWKEGPVWCRSLIDWLPNDQRLWRCLYDYKSTSASAHPDAWGGRTAWGMQFDIQDAFTTRGFRHLMKMKALPKPHKGKELDDGRQEIVYAPNDPLFRFVVQERAYPHCICVFEMSPAARHMAMRKVEAGIKIWSECLERGEWPGYPNRVVMINPPEWREREWLDREHSGRLDGSIVDQLTEGFAPL